MSARDFLAAIRAGDAETVASMLDRDPSLASVRDGEVTAVLLAAYHGRNEIAKTIAARRADLTLPEACAIGDEVRAMNLLAADHSLLDVPGADGHYPLGLAIFFRHPSLARRLIEAGADVRLHSRNAQNVAPIHAAAAVCDHELMLLLLERGADSNARQESGYGPLHTAAARGDLEGVTLLLRHGAERDSKGTDGKTPADVAREHGQQNLADWLSSQ